MEPKLHRLAEVQELTRLSKSTLYRQIRAGTFPKPVRIGERAVAWRADDVDEWLKTRKEADWVDPDDTSPKMNTGRALPPPGSRLVRGGDPPLGGSSASRASPFRTHHGEREDRMEKNQKAEAAIPPSEIGGDAPHPGTLCNALQQPPACPGNDAEPRAAVQTPSTLR